MSQNWILRRYRTPTTHDLLQRLQQGYRVPSVSNSTQISGITKADPNEKSFKQGDVLDEIVEMSELQDGGKDEEENFSVEEGNVGTESEWDDEVARDGGTQVVRVEVHRLTTISERTEEG